MRSAFPAASTHKIYSELSSRILDEADVHLLTASDSSSDASGGGPKNYSHHHHRRANNKGTTTSAASTISAAASTTTRFLTAFQLADYLSGWKSSDGARSMTTSAMPLSSAIHHLGAEISSTNNLTSTFADAVVKEVMRFREKLEGDRPTLPPPSALKALSLILLDPSQYHSEILQSVGESCVTSTSVI